MIRSHDSGVSSLQNGGRINSTSYLLSLSFFLIHFFISPPLSSLLSLSFSLSLSLIPFFLYLSVSLFFFFFFFSLSFSLNPFLFPSLISSSLQNKHTDITCQAGSYLANPTPRLAPEWSLNIRVDTTTPYGEMSLSKSWEGGEREGGGREGRGAGEWGVYV